MEMLLASCGPSSFRAAIEAARTRACTWQCAHTQLEP